MNNIKGIRKCVTFINKQCMFARIYLDTSTKKLITLQYAGTNSYTIFEDNDVKEIGQWNARQGKITMNDVKYMIKRFYPN